MVGGELANGLKSLRGMIVNVSLSVLPIEVISRRPILIRRQQWCVIRGQRW